jgi:hypothetical protein
MLARLAAAGFSGNRAAGNIGHNQARMTFLRCRDEASIRNSFGLNWQLGHAALQPPHTPARREQGAVKGPVRRGQWPIVRSSEIQD